MNYHTRGIRIHLTVLTILISSTLAAWTQSRTKIAGVPSEPPGAIRLVSGMVPTRAIGVTARNTELADARARIAGLVGGERLPLMVQFAAPISNAETDRMLQYGAHVAGYLPDNALLLLADDTVLNNLAGDPDALWIGVYKPEYKIHPAARGHLERLPEPVAVQSPVADDEMLFNIVIFDPERTAAVADAARRRGALVIGYSAGPRRGIVRLTTRDLEVLRQLAEMPSVEWIERYIPPRFLNDIAAQSPRMNVEAVHAAGLTGAGQVVAVCDTGLDMGCAQDLHPDFTNRLKAAFGWGRANRWDDPHGHGTHCAGSVLGDGSAWSNGLFKGMAFRAELVMQSILNDAGGLGLPEDLNEIFLQAYTNDARIHSDSWGASMNAYTASSRQADEFVWTNPDMLIVFAAGNDGADDNADGVIDAGSIGTPATAKNVLSVGAAQSWRPTGSGGYSAKTCGGWGYPLNPIRDSLVSTPWDGVHQGMAAFSSRGPCADGRIKPDIVAPGTDIISCRSRAPGASPMWGTGVGVLGNAASNYYTFAGGTSMSTPLTAGAAALVREYYVGTRAHPSPSAALIKATLAAGARTLNPGQYGVGRHREIPGGARPNNIEGWGQVDLYATLYPGNDTLTNVFYDNNALYTGYADTYSFTPNVSNRVSIMLAWSDYPGSEAAAANLVNDLDLVVTAPDGRVYYPNGGNAPDRINNMEGVDIAAALPGEYMIQVIAHQVPFGPQPYALVIHEAAPVDAHTLIGAWHAPLSPRADSEVTISAEIAGGGDDLSAISQWRVNAGTWNLQALTISNTWPGHSLFAGTLPALPAGSMVEYFVMAAGAGWSATGTVARYTVQAPIIHVAPNGRQQSPYDTPARAFTNIQAAVNYANDGAEIIVAPGYYRENILIENAVTLRGAGAETIIDGAGRDTCLRAVGNVLIDGFTLTGGRGIQGGGANLNIGTLQNCLVISNTAETGGGVYAYNATVENCRIVSNSANAGGGIYLAMRSIASNCRIMHNTAAEAGGGVVLYGMFPFNVPAVHNAVIVGNTAAGYGGGAAGLMGFIDNATFYRNAAPTGGGFCGLLLGIVHNSIFQDNGSDAVAALEIMPGMPGALLYNCCLEHIPVGEGISITNSIKDNPRLRDPANGDFRLKPNSPCRDSGTNTAWMADATDMDGRPRIINGIADIGAYELPDRRDYPNFAASRNAVGDYDGDGRLDPAVYHASSGFWRIALSGSGYAVTENLFGGSDWLPASADYTGNRLTDLALYREADGFCLTAANEVALLGGAGWLPVIGDFDGDGICDPAVYHSASGTWRALLSASGYAETAVVLGGPGYVPVPADYDGDGRSDPAVFSASAGIWLTILSSRPGVVQSLAFGEPGDLPVSADYDGDGLADPACYNPMSGYWRALLSDNGYAPASLPTLAGNLYPVHGDYDNDGLSDPALYNAAEGVWTAWLSGSRYAPTRLALGGPGWLPAR